MTPRLFLIGLSAVLVTGCSGKTYFYSGQCTISGGYKQYSGIYIINSFEMSPLETIQDLTKRSTPEECVKEGIILSITPFP